MRLTLEQFRERVIDYLYGELEGDELRAFEAALAESEACRRELEALQRTLGMARRGLRGSLSEEPPARVRSAVLAAAALEARDVAGQRTRTAAAQERGGGRRVLDALRAFLRTPWLFPALGAAAAVLFVVLRERADHVASSELAAPREPAAERVAPVPGATAPSTDEESASAAPVEARAPAGERNDVEARGSAGERDDVEARGSAGERNDVEARGSARERSGAQRPARQLAPSAATGQPSVAPLARARREAKGFAVPPPPAPKKAARPIERLAETSRAREAEAPADELAARAPEPPPTPTAAPGGRSFAQPPPATLGDADAREEASAKAPAAVARDLFGAGAAAPRAPAVAASDARVGRAELVRSAREHVLARRWQRAAEAYGELLRRYPNDREAPAWRTQLALARQALGNDRDAAH